MLNFEIYHARIRCEIELNSSPFMFCKKVSQISATHSVSINSSVKI